MGRPGYHWPNGTAVDEASRARFLAGRFGASVILTVSALADAVWLREHATLLVTRIYESAGDLAAPADVAARHASWCQQVDPGGYVQLLNEPDVEYPSKTPEHFASWWDVCAGFFLQACPRLRLGFPAPSVGGPADYLPRVAAAGGLRRASFLAERGYWQRANDARSPIFGLQWERSLPYRLPIVLTEFGCSDPAVTKLEKAREYNDYSADLPRFVVAAGAFIGAGGDPHWDSVAAGCLWIDDAMAGAIGSQEGERAMDEAMIQRVGQYAGLIQSYSARNNLPPSLVAGLIAVESGGQADATSPDNGPGLGHALGLMQVLEGNFPPGENGHDPETNIRVGTGMLRAKTDAFGGRLGSGLAAYFGAVDQDGNPTSGTDLTGTTGVRYVQEVEGAAASFGDLDPAAPSPVPRAAEVDADFASYAPHTGTWREAAINLKGVADDALGAGRKIVEEVAASWRGR